MSKFKVTINRTEFYRRDVEVEADSLEQALKVAEENERNNEYDFLFDMPDDVSVNFKDGGNGSYRLKELPAIDIDSWVEGIAAMCEIAEVRKQAYELAGMVEDENDPICPGEMESEYTELADRYDFRFNSKGRILSYNLKKGKGE